MSCFIGQKAPKNLSACRFLDVLIFAFSLHAASFQLSEVCTESSLLAFTREAVSCPLWYLLWGMLTNWKMFSFENSISYCVGSWSSQFFQVPIPLYLFPFLVLQCWEFSPGPCASPPTNPQFTTGLRLVPRSWTKNFLTTLTCCFINWRVLACSFSFPGISWEEYQQYYTLLQS